MANYQNTYWCHKGKHEEINAAVAKLVPLSGEVPNKKQNPKLELFRRASNAYYDLYNNGLCNLRAEFVRVFHFSPDRELTQYTIDETEKRMDAIIEAAAFEQGLVKLVLK